MNKYINNAKSIIVIICLFLLGNFLINYNFKVNFFDIGDEPPIDSIEPDYVDDYESV